MCKKTLCKNCNNCQSRTLSEDSSNIKITWQQEQRLDDLRLELDTLCRDITLCKQEPVVDENVLQELQERLLTTYNHAVKVGLSYRLEDV
ncbi:hypothetical protein [Pseudoalteromonas phage PH357]|nr:hypothetical protein [Pseudoalteromonas phage PH357]